MLSFHMIVYNLYFEIESPTETQTLALILSQKYFSLRKVS